MWPFRAPASTSSWAIRTLKVSGIRETVGSSSISMIREGWLGGYQGEARERGESDFENPPVGGRNISK
jgi:hypothetical protein